ncbi:MAG: YkvA family protein [Acidimicrobiia bacterium]
MTQRVTPDGVIPPEGAATGSRLEMREAWNTFPSLIKLIGRLLRDTRVPRRAKLTLGLAAAYVASPIDLLPESIPVVGWADDVLLVMLALESLIHRAGPDLVREHWDGPGDILDLIQDLLGLSRSVLPRRITALVDRISG